MKYNPVMEDDQLISIHYESILDLMDHQVDGPNRKEFIRRLDCDDPNFGKDKIGRSNNNGRDVIKHALLGDEYMYGEMMELAKRLPVDDITTDYEQKVKVRRRRKIKSNFGDELDIHKIYQGDLERSWTRTVRDEVDQNHHLVTILVDIGANYKVDCSHSLWLGAVTLKIVKELEAAGKSIKIIVGDGGKNTFSNSVKNCTTTMVVKNYNEGLSHTRLAAMCHLGFFRTFCFAAFFSDPHLFPNPGLGKYFPLKPGVVPVQMKSEVDNGHTKLVYVKTAHNIRQAQGVLADAYEQMRSFID